MVRIPFLTDEPAAPPAAPATMIVTDPRITYLIALGDGSHGVSAFQSFHEALVRLHWAFEEMVLMPATIFEPVAPQASLIALRACGIAGWRYQLLPARAVPIVPITKAHPFFVVFSDDIAAARAISDAFPRNRPAPFHISTQEVAGAFQPGAVGFNDLKDHCLNLIDQHPGLGLADLRPVIAAWQPRRVVASKFDFKGNYTVLPNQMTLKSLGVVPRREVPDWSSSDPDDYLQAILESAAAVERFRVRGKIDDAIRLMPPRPDTWIVAPSLAPDFKDRLNMEGVPASERNAVRDLLRLFERQRTFGVQITEDQLARLKQSPAASELMLVRALETKTFAAAVGAAAASTVASVYRLAPAIDQVAGRVRQFAGNVRAEARTPPGKVAKLFEDVQDHLGSAVAPEILRKVADSTWGIKAVTDAPVEWLPIDGLPLGLLRNISRIPATPGDLTVQLLAKHEPIRIPTKDFSEVLVISAFEQDDRFDMMRKSFDITEPGWSKKVDLRFVRAATEAEFIGALRDFRGPLLIFDGHGVHPRGASGRLVLGKEQIDVWSLRGKVQVPPIVLLSACDTHAADRSWSTVSNAFLTLGARTVLATMLPIGVREGAIFAARFVFRIAEFLPAAAGFLGRVVRWSEVVGGMLRMQLLTDIIKPVLLDGRLQWDDYHAVLSRANFHANGEGRHGLDYLERELVARGIFTNEKFRETLRLTIPRSDTIRYAQMGSPETILVGSVEDLPAEVCAQFAAFGSAVTPIWRDEPELDISVVAAASDRIRHLLEKS